MLGAIAGDIIGSVFEWHPVAGNWDEFPLFSEKSRFTDDTVMTIAVSKALLNPGDDFKSALIDAFHEFGQAWPWAGYGGKFKQWLMFRKREPYNSFGNGSAMRVSPVGWAAQTLAETEKLACESAEVTHNHPEGIKGAQAVAGAIYLARTGKSKEEIRDYLTGRHGYDLSRSLEEIRQNYKYEMSCQRSVPEALQAFLESSSFEEAVRKAIWLRGDADTQAAIAGSVAEAFYQGVPEKIAEECLIRLDEPLRRHFQNWQEALRESGASC